MLHPVGSLPASVYWRRRLLLLAVAIMLAALTAYVLRPGGSKPSAAPPTGARSSSSNAALTTTSSAPQNPLSTPTVPGASQSAPRTSTHSTPTSPTTCQARQLKIAAVVAQQTYNVGDEPQLMLQVTNTGPTSCVQDLADKQVELRVYNGESRVWGSHDCEIQPGTADRTLIVNQPVRVSIIWSGLSSQPNCAGTRQRVGAGTYTLYAYLSGYTGTAAQFSIS